MYVDAYMWYVNFLCFSFFEVIYLILVCILHLSIFSKEREKEGMDLKESGDREDLEGHGKGKM